jgi:hypothetical protein
MQARWQSPAERSDKRAHRVSRHWLLTANNQNSSRILSTAGNAGCCIWLWASAGVGSLLLDTPGVASGCGQVLR